MRFLNPEYKNKGKIYFLFFLVLLLVVSFAFPSLASEAKEVAKEAMKKVDPNYRQFWNLNPRILIWIVAELHLLFGAFVLGVPIFISAIEVIGYKTGEEKYDHLAHEFTKLLSTAFSTTAAFGGLLAFCLFSLYPKVMNYLTGIFGRVMYIYALLFFAEGFTLYIYYYSWDKMKEKKIAHISLGILLNLIGTTLMSIANSWATFMMIPPLGKMFDEKTGQFLGTLWEAVNNPIWISINAHRLISNIAFGGFVCGAYAAFKFLGSTTAEEKAHYDWMGYIGNIIGVGALMVMIYVGYYHGREIYKFNPVMGNNMMGGAFSWTFIMQAMMIGNLFIASNYYLWLGMGRIPGSERYTKYIKYLNFIILVCFAIWWTPHNLPLSASEQMAIGGQYHPILKYLGLMPAKNAVISFIIMTTFLSVLLYKRGNKGETIDFAQQKRGTKITLLVIGALVGYLLYLELSHIAHLDPGEMDLAPEKAKYFKLPVYLLSLQLAALVLSLIMTFKNKGKIAEMIYFVLTVVSATFILGVYGFAVMTEASPFLRDIAFTQAYLVLTSMTFITAMDSAIFKGAKEVAEIQWGKMPVRSQYALIYTCIFVVLTMGLMGYIRSGLRENWHVYGVLKDTSQFAFTPSNFDMSLVVSLCAVIFLALVSFVFWLGSLAEKKKSGGSEQLAVGSKR